MHVLRFHLHFKTTVSMTCFTMIVDSSALSPGKDTRRSSWQCGCRTQSYLLSYSPGLYRDTPPMPLASRMQESCVARSGSRFNAADTSMCLHKRVEQAEHDDDDGKSGNVDYKASTSSTVYYRQEPFHVFRERVARLCEREFDNATVTIERMKGGTYNRVTAITVDPLPPRTLSLPWFRSFFLSDKAQAETQRPKRYILRTLRKEQADDDWGMAYDAPTLTFARRILGPIVPEIIRLDVSSTNVLSRPYTIQERLPGHNLNRIWERLTMAQKECALRIIVDLTKVLHTIKNSASGVIAHTDFVNSPNEVDICMHSFKVGNNKTPARVGPRISLARTQTTLEFMLEQARRWENLDEHYWSHYRDAPNKHRWGQFIIIAQALHIMGYIGDNDQFYFCHLDLYARNILVEVEDEETLKLTGVLDWDTEFAHFCPKFVAYRAPIWLWLDEGLDQWDEMNAATEPTDPELIRLKKLWEELASDEWKRYAYMPEYMIARRLFTRLKGGICRVGDGEEAQSIIDDWQKLHYDERLVTIEILNSGSQSESDMNVDSDHDVLEAELRRKVSSDGCETRML
jgi:hypothetical protein